MDNQITQAYYQLTGHTYDEALLIYEQLIINGPHTGDLYFQTFGVPNIILKTDYPYERFTCYERLLNILQLEDKNKFISIHKGTPYYFLAWLSFEIANYHRATYYLDSAICEDQRSFPYNWRTTPGTYAILLQIDKSGPVKRVVEWVRTEFKKQIESFNQDTHLNLSIDNIVNNLFTDLYNPLKKNKAHSIMTALYTFICEYEGIRNLIILGNSISSLESLLLHLFKGGLIFESLLRHLYSHIIISGGGKFMTLSQILNLSKVKADFNLNDNMNFSADSLEEVMENSNSSSVKDSFLTIGRIRNFSGHDLARENDLNNIYVYENLYRQISNSIFFILHKFYS